MKRIVMGAFALTFVFTLAGAAHAQVICSKTNSKGKVKYKLRDACKSNEVVSQDFAGFVPADVATMADVAAVPRTRVYSFDSDFEFVSLDTAFAPVPLNGTETTVEITTTAASTDLVITFNAECQGPDNGGDWVDVDVKVDGLTLAPTAQPDDAFCVGLYEMHSVTVVAHNLAAGVHPVTVEARETVAAGSWLDDIGITILAIED